MTTCSNDNNRHSFITAVPAITAPQKQNRKPAKTDIKQLLPTKETLST
jgi:hypothetical protein